jgi:hypothetical protein
MQHFTPANAAAVATPPSVGFWAAGLARAFGRVGGGRSGGVQKPLVLQGRAARAFGFPS